MASGKMVVVNDANFNTEVEKTATTVLVDFGATWCQPCKVLSSTLEGMVDDFRGKVKFCYVDIQQAPQAAQRFAVRSVPTLVVFKNGAPAGSLLGAVPRNKVEQLLSQVG